MRFTNSVLHAQPVTMGECANLGSAARACSCATSQVMLCWVSPAEFGCSHLLHELAGPDRTLCPKKLWSFWWVSGQGLEQRHRALGTGQGADLALDEPSRRPDPIVGEQGCDGIPDLGRCGGDRV